MAKDDLVLQIGVTERRLLDQIKRVEKRMISSARRSENAWRKTNRSISQSFSGLQSAALRATASIAAFTYAANRVTRIADSYTNIENRLRSIGQAGDEAGEKLLAAAIRSRSGIEDMATGVARFHKSTGDSYDTTIRRIETLNKLLLVTGSTTAEANSVMLQFSQALSSGNLAGDELRSLREAAPIELLDALAEAAGVSRSELKGLGEQGLLTTEIMTTALDSLASTADEKFGDVQVTASQAFTNIQSAMTVFVGRLNEGLGATDALSGGMQDLSVWLQNNVAEAEEFGRSIAAALQTAGEYADAAYTALTEMAGAINDATSDVFGIGEAFSESGATIGDVIRSIINAMAEFAGIMGGSADAVREAFLQIPDAISSGMQGAVNAVISAVETMINGVLDGVRSVAAAINQIPGVDVGGGPGNVSLGRVEGLETSLSRGSVSGAFAEGYVRDKADVLDAADAVENFFKGIGESYKKNRAELEEAAKGEDFTPTPAGQNNLTTADGSGGGSASKGGGGGKGRAGRAESPFFGDIEKDLLNLERQISLVGKSNEQIAEARARWELLDEAKKRGMPINEQLNEQINAQAAEVGRLTGELERAEIAQQQFDAAIDGIADAMAGALVAGESLRDGLAQVLKGIASDIINSGIRNALLGQFGVGGGGGGGLLGNLFGGLFGGAPSFDGGGFTGMGGRSGGIDGKGGFPAILHPNETVVDHTRGQSSGGSADVNVTVSVDQNGNLQAFVDNRAANISRQAVASYDKAMPSRVQQINANPRRR